MTKNIEITIDVKIARRMLGVAGFQNISQLSNEEVFEKVLTLITPYGAKASINNLPDTRDKINEYIMELDAEIDRCNTWIEGHMNDEACKVSAVESRAITLLEVKNDLNGRLKELI